jgi:bifunctional N-acetylglucosamine-1-phosphate-uridyltransferase/glucosamine-1-phosphate-acetyltransferase GlmU-like protein
MVEIIIMAGGSGERWGNFLGTPKQLIQIGGESLVSRAVRLCKQNGIPSSNITVLIPPADSARFYADLQKHQVRIVEVSENQTGVDKFWNGLPYWNKEAIYLYGDVFFSEEAMRTIIKTEVEEGQFKAFGRQFGNNRKPYGELFAYHSHTKKTLTEALTYLRSINAIGGWQLYRYRAGYNLLKHEIDEHFINIDDLTDDFDKPEEYIAWVKEAQEIWQK